MPAVGVPLVLMLMLWVRLLAELVLSPCTLCYVITLMVHSCSCAALHLNTALCIIPASLWEIIEGTDVLLCWVSIEGGHHSPTGGPAAAVASAAATTTSSASTATAAVAGFLELVVVASLAL